MTKFAYKATCFNRILDIVIMINCILFRVIGRNHVKCAIFTFTSFTFHSITVSVYGFAYIPISVHTYIVVHVCIFNILHRIRKFFKKHMKGYKIVDE